MREVHALCVKISRALAGREIQTHAFAGISEENPVGIGSAKGF